MLSNIYSDITTGTLVLSNINIEVKVKKKDIFLAPPAVGCALSIRLYCLCPGPGHSGWPSQMTEWVSVPPPLVNKNIGGTSYNDTL